MTLSRDQLKAIYPSATWDNIDKYLPWIVKYMETCSVNTPVRAAAFLAQVGHECAQFRCVEENLNYSASGLLATFPGYFTAADAAKYAHKPVEIANRAYAGRYGNGDQASGDGYKYHGRGLMQVTFKDNYAAFSREAGFNFVNAPTALATEPKWAVLAAFWYWKSRGLNSLADSGDFDTMTKKINGGHNGLEDRKAIWARAKKTLGA